MWTSTKSVINRHYEVYLNHNIRGIEQCRFNIVLLKRKEKKRQKFVWTMTSLFLYTVYRHLVPIQRGHLDLVTIAELMSASASLFLEGMHQNSANFDNPLFHPPTAKPSMWCEERRAKFRLSKNDKETQLLINNCFFPPDLYQPVTLTECKYFMETSVQDFCSCLPSSLNIIINPSVSSGFLLLPLCYLQSQPISCSLYAIMMETLGRSPVSDQRVCMRLKARLPLFPSVWKSHQEM